MDRQKRLICNKNANRLMRQNSSLPFTFNINDLFFVRPRTRARQNVSYHSDLLNPLAVPISYLLDTRDDSPDINELICSVVSFFDHSSF